MPFFACSLLALVLYFVTLPLFGTDRIAAYVGI